jgi:hypothetical protein
MQDPRTRSLLGQGYNDQGVTFATVGIPARGDNHSIVCGAPSLDGWLIVRREFRGNLEWAVVVPGDGAVSPAVARLLDELLARGITFHDFRFGP